MKTYKTIRLFVFLILSCLVIWKGYSYPVINPFWMDKANYMILFGVVSLIYYGYKLSKLEL